MVRRVLAERGRTRDVRRPEIFHAIGEQIRLYAFLFHRQSALVFALIALLFISRGKIQMRARLKTVWPVFVLAAVPFAMYGRYLAPFFVLLWSAGFACVLEESRALH